jgi:hypothetical protein
MFPRINNRPAIRFPLSAKEKARLKAGFFEFFRG